MASPVEITGPKQTWALWGSHGLPREMTWPHGKNSSLFLENCRKISGEITWALLETTWASGNTGPLGNRGAHRKITSLWETTWFPCGKSRGPTVKSRSPRETSWFLREITGPSGNHAASSGNHFTPQENHGLPGKSRAFQGGLPADSTGAGSSKSRVSPRGNHRPHGNRSHGQHRGPQGTAAGPREITASRHHAGPGGANGPRRKSPGRHPRGNHGPSGSCCTLGNVTGPTGNSTRALREITWAPGCVELCGSHGKPRALGKPQIF